MKLEYIILAVIFVILLLAVLKINKKDVKLEFNKLTSFLGGKDNIIDTEVNLSRFIVTVKDINKVDKDAIIELGGKYGVVSVFLSIFYLFFDKVNICKFALLNI